MAKRRKKRYCHYCGQEFKSWHAHKHCKPVVEEVEPEPEKPERNRDYRLGMVTGNGQMVWRRTG